MGLKSKLLKIILPFIIVLAGVAVMAVLISSRPAPKKEVKKDSRALVRVLKVTKEDRQVLVQGTGIVQAAREVTVIPRVSGRVTYISESLVPGGFFRKGDLLFEIEDVDYRLAVERAKAARAKAEYNLATVESSARIARTEWERISKDNPAEPNPLVLYEPQLKNARTALTSAIAALKQAELNLERTRILAPFNCRVHSEKIDSGQFIRAGSLVAVLTGADTAEIIVPLPLDELHWLNIPRGGAERGSQATVELKAGNRTYRWQGRLVRSLGEVDPKSHMAKVVVAVNDPYGLTGKKDIDLAVGTFVEVQLKGAMLKGVIVIPRYAFRENSTVWVMDETNRLRIKKVAPLRIQGEYVLIKEGLDSGDSVVLTTLSGAADSMKLQPVKEGAGP